MSPEFSYSVTEFPYPMSKGHLILPEGINVYNLARHKKFKCWCGLMTVMKMFIEMKTVRGLTHAYCPDCSLDMVLDEKYHSAKMGMNYPANNKYGTMVPASSTTYAFHLVHHSWIGSLSLATGVLQWDQKYCPPVSRSFAEKQVAHNTVMRLQIQFRRHLVFTQTVQAHLWQKDVLLDLVL
ncbi:hypothetical protein BU17DRAFT_62153 [Hysterangium stoloniferum]|nr:hypothetical protein BU17DRAFT_62153 [Hysterangium stoloniferum]